VDYNLAFITVLKIHTALLGSGQGPSNTDDLLLLPTNTTITEMDTAVFVCLSANLSFRTVWSFHNTLNAIIGQPNNYSLCLKDVEKSVSISCTVNGKTSNSFLSLQGNFMFV